MLLELLNHFQRKSIIIVNVVGVIIALSLTLASLVKSSDWPTFLLMAVVLLEGTLGLISMIGGMANVYLKSVQVIKKFRLTFGSRLDLQWQVRFQRSCKPLKIMIGWGNFIDQQTPLTCIDTSLSQCVDLLLIGKS